MSELKHQYISTWKYIATYYCLFLHNDYSRACGVLRRFFRSMNSP